MKDEKVNLIYIAGDYPTTMQAYFDKYDKQLYDEVYKEYLKKYFGLTDDVSFDYEENSNDKFYLNFTAFIILDEKNKIKWFAFDEFNDLVWILKVINIDGIKLSLDKVVYDKISADLNNYPCLKMED